MSNEPFKASEKDWEQIENIAEIRAADVCRALLELRDRVAALEAGRAKESGKCPKTLEAFKQIGEYVKPRSPLCADPRNPFVSHSVGEARPLEECGKDHAVPEPSPSPAGDAGLVKEVLDAMGEGTEVEARAAIHAVARWLLSEGYLTAASLLGREANR